LARPESSEGKGHLKGPGSLKALLRAGRLRGPSRLGSLVTPGLLVRSFTTFTSRLS
jgi:hypothetical protein